MKFKTFLFLLPALLYECFAFSQTAPIEITKTGQLIFHQTEKGDRVPDFSYCGYRASELPIPNIPVKVIVPHQAGDATANIQQALDFVGELPADQDGFRGAVLLEKGNFQVTGQLLIDILIGLLALFAVFALISISSHNEPLNNAQVRF